MGFSMKSDYTNGIKKQNKWKKERKRMCRNPMMKLDLHRNFQKNQE